MVLLTTIAASLIIGLIVGMLSGMLGIGGGTILVPVFKLLFGMAPLQSTATSLFTIIPTSISGAATHIQKRTCIVALGVAAGIGGALTSPLGVWLASISPEWGTMVAAAAVIGWSAYTMLRKALKMKPAGEAEVPDELDSEPDPVPESDSESDSGPMPDPLAEARQMSARKVVTAACIGLVSGVLSGYVGVGGGFIMVPLFMQLLGTPMKLTSGTSLIAVMILAVPGVITQAMLGNVEWVAGIFVSCGTIPGAIIGSRLMARVPERTLRFLFAGFLFVAAAALVVDQLGIF